VAAEPERSQLRAVAHAVLRAEAGAVGLGRLCPRCGSSVHGRPVARTGSGGPLQVSISYTAGLVAVAWSRTSRVGVDVERDGPPVDGLDRRGFTRAEALFKAGGGMPTRELDLPDGYVGTLAGVDVSWRLAGPAAPAG